MRRAALIGTAFLAAVSMLIMEATSEYMLLPIQDDLDLSSEEIHRLTIVLEVAGLLMIFAAGVLAVRLGRRATVLIASVVVMIGSLGVTLSTNGTGVLIGRSLVGMGVAVMSVAGLSLINVTFQENKSRARAFGFFGASSPAVFIVAPTAGALVATHFGWRMVPMIWLGIAATLAALAPVCVPAHSASKERAEFWTPVLAGLVLTGLATAAVSVLDGGVFPVIALALTISAALLLYHRMRSGRAMSLDLRVFKKPGSLLAAGAVLTGLTVNISYYVGMFANHRYDLPLPVLALLMALPEVAGIAGSFVFAYLAGRTGSGFAAMVALGTAAATSLLLLTISTASPVVHVILITMLVNIPIAGAYGPIAENLLNFAPADGSDGAASVNDALTSMGVVIGAVGVGALAVSSFQSSLTTDLVEHGVAPAHAETIAKQARTGIILTELIDHRDNVQLDLESFFFSARLPLESARVDALHEAAICLSITSAAGSGLLLASNRRKRSAIAYETTS